MRVYKYRLQWIFPLEKAIKMLELIGVKSLTRIYFRDKTLRILGQYKEWKHSAAKDVQKETIKYIKKTAGENKKILYIELYRE